MSKSQKFLHSSIVKPVRQSNIVHEHIGINWKENVYVEFLIELMQEERQIHFQDNSPTKIDKEILEEFQDRPQEKVVKQQISMNTTNFYDSNKLDW